LKEARNVKYASFVEPGQRLTVVAQIDGQNERETKLKAWGTVDDAEVTVVSGRLTLERYNLADDDPEAAEADAVLVRQLRSQFALLSHFGEAAAF